MGKHVVVFPVFVPGIDLQTGEVEWSEFSADLFEMFSVAAVTAEKDFSAAVFDNPARPERLETVFQRSAGKMTTRLPSCKRCTVCRNVDITRAS